MIGPPLPAVAATKACAVMVSGAKSTLCPPHMAGRGDILSPARGIHAIQGISMSALICGSLAYDTIMVFPDQFKNHILPDKVHILNVSFLVPRMRREFGGCAGNIAYNLKLLGGEPVPMATVGRILAPIVSTSRSAVSAWIRSRNWRISSRPRRSSPQTTTTTRLQPSILAR